MNDLHPPQRSPVPDDLADLYALLREATCPKEERGVLRYPHPADPDFRADPIAFYERLRVAGPVVPLEFPNHSVPNGFMVTSYELCRKVFGSSGQFTVANSEMRHADGHQDEFRLRSYADMAANIIIFSDGPRHARIREVLKGTLTPDAVKPWVGPTREIARSLLDAALSKPSFDLIADYAVPLPALLMAEMLGMPKGDLAPLMEHLMDAAAGQGFFVSREQFSIMNRKTRAVGGYFAKNFDSLAPTPVVCAFRDAIHDGSLTPKEAIANITFLLFSGHETTSAALASAVDYMAADPALERTFREYPHLAPQFMREAMRLAPPVHLTSRVAKQWVVLEDALVPPGSYVLVNLAAAGRDPAVIPDPHRFDPFRSTKYSLSFGSNRHTCIGMPLAMMMLPLSLQLLAERLPLFRRAKPEPEIRFDGTFFGYQTYHLENTGLG